MNPFRNDWTLRLTRTEAGVVRVTLLREGEEAEFAADSLAVFDPAELEARYLKPLHAFVEAPVSPELLQDLGRSLAGLLLPPGVRARLGATWMQSASTVPLRLRLQCADPGLAGLPWEFAYLEEDLVPGGNPGFLGLHPRLLLARRPAVPTSIEAVEADPLRVLIAWADPRSASYPALPHLQAEVKSIVSELQARRLHGRVDVLERPSATPASLQRALQTYAPHVLHFIGHGDTRPSGGFLVLEGDRAGGDRPVYADELARWLAATPARLVVLSACRTGAPESGIAQALAEGGIGAVVAMQLPLRDAAARPFARAFYGTLLETGNVEEALKEGRQAIQGFGPDWGVPALTLAGASGALFRRPEAVALSPLPAGVVTFLFTDIEGSTKKWQEHPQAMPGALQAHNHLIQAAVEQHHGQVFKTIGDAFCAAFTDPVAATKAALEAQKALCAHDWSLVGGLRVRIALHTGTAERVDDDYFGLTLSRVARLLKVCQGGQVLLSRATSEMVREVLPDAASLKDHGSHRLPDLREPEHIFQLLHLALPAELLDLRSLDELPNNLPQQLSSFIGRERELQEVTQSLTKTRLLTLTGAGGCGKTRLALQVAADVLNDYEDGVWLVELAPLSDPALVPQAVASALGVQEAPGQSLTETLTSALKPKTLLLLLDNCEHLLEACAGLAYSLLRACPNLRILATSRKGLGHEGEMTYLLSPLSLPDPKTLPPLEKLPQYEAVRLFCERAAFKLPGFALTEQNAPAVTKICRRVDGIPLAIELAAARLSALSVEQIAQFEDYFRLLTDRQRKRPLHQQALRTTLDWSYDLLTPQEQILLCRLSVFAGGWTLEAAEQVCSGDGLESWEILDLMASLVEASLVIAEDREGERSYRMLETVRQYAAQKLEKAGQAEVLRGRHLAHFLALAEEAEPGLMGAEQVRWLNRLEREHGNFRAALTEAINGEARLRLAAALWRFWLVRGYYSEGSGWLESALAKSSKADPALRARALCGAGILVCEQTDYRAARSFLEESLRIRRESGDMPGVAEVLNHLGNLERNLGETDLARSHYEESLSLRQKFEHKPGIAASLSNLGMMARDEGDHALARRYFEQSLEAYRKLGNEEGMAATLLNLGVVLHEQGNYREARARYEEALALYRTAVNKGGIALCLLNIGEVFLNERSYAEAQGLLQDSLLLWTELGDRRDTAYVLALLGVAAKDQGDAERAVCLFASAEAMREQAGSHSPLSERPDTEANIASTRSELGEEAFKEAWEWGKRLSLQEAIAYALNEK